MEQELNLISLDPLIRVWRAFDLLSRQWPVDELGEALSFGILFGIYHWDFLLSPIQRWATWSMCRGRSLSRVLSDQAAKKSGSLLRGASGTSRIRTAAGTPVLTPVTSACCWPCDRPSRGDDRGGRFVVTARQRITAINPVFPGLTAAGDASATRRTFARISHVQVSLPGGTSSRGAQEKMRLASGCGHAFAVDREDFENPRLRQHSVGVSVCAQLPLGEEEHVVRVADR